jgi:predicted metal-dependent HD superfamily phosphohydrolase
MQFIRIAREFIHRYLENLPDNLYYHNLNHTEDVFRYAGIIASNEGLNAEEREIVLLAALFHDAGYKESYKMHEAAGRRMASEYLADYGYPIDKSIQVLDCICATRYPQRPAGKLQEVVCDADMFHLSTYEFFFKTELLRNEWNAVLNAGLSPKEHLENTICFMDAHDFVSPYGKEILTNGKNRNIEKLHMLLNMIA